MFLKNSGNRKRKMIHKPTTSFSSHALHNEREYGPYSVQKDLAIPTYNSTQNLLIV